MANLNKENIITVDVKNATVKTEGSMSFYVTDIKTCNIYCQLVVNASKSALITKYHSVDNAEDFTVTLRLIKPNNEPKELEFILLDKADAFFYVDLTDEYKDHAGTYKCELFVDCLVNGELERITTSSFTYTVHKSIWSDLDGILNGGNPAQPLIEKLATIAYVDDSILAIPDSGLLNSYSTRNYVDTSIDQYDNKIIKQDFASRQYVNDMFNNVKYDIEVAGYTTESYVDDKVFALRTDFANSFAPLSYVNEKITQINTSLLYDYATTTYVNNKYSPLDSRLINIESKNYIEKEVYDKDISRIETRATDALDIANECFDEIYDIPNYYAKITYVDQKIAEAQLGGGEGGSVDLTGYATKEYVDDAVANIEIPEVEMPDLSGYATTEYVDGIISVIDKADATGEITYDDFADGFGTYKLNGTVYFTIDDKERQMVFRNEIVYIEKRKVGPINLLRICRTRIVTDVIDGPDYLHISNGETANYHFFATQSYVDNAIANKADKSYVEAYVNTYLGDIESLLEEI